MQWRFLSGYLLFLSIHGLRCLAWGTSQRRLTSRVKVRLLTPVIYSSAYLTTYSITGPGFDLALEDVKTLFPKVEFTQEIIVTNISDCRIWNEEVANLVAAAYYKPLSKDVPGNKNEMTAVVTGGCSGDLPMARLTSALNILYVTSVTTPVNFDRQRKERFSTWLSTGVTTTLVPYVKFYSNLMVKFNWKTAVVIADVGGNPFTDQMAQIVFQELTVNHGHQLDYISLNSSSPTAIDFVSLLKLVQLTSRVCFFFGTSKPLRQFMEAADQMGMTNGDYVYFATYFYLLEGVDGWNVKKESGQVAEKLYKTLFLVEADYRGIQGGIARDFDFIWRERSAKNYGKPYLPNQLMTPVPASSYSAIMMLAQVISELTRGRYDYDYSDGASLARNFHNRTFVLPTGNIFLDSTGSRTIPLNVKKLSNSTLEFQTIFVQDAESYQWTEVTNFSWPVEWPIKDQPLCGVRNGTCVVRSDSAKVMSIALCLTCIPVLGFIIIFMKQRASDKAASQRKMWWELQITCLNFNSRSWPRQKSLIIYLH